MSAPVYIEDIFLVAVSHILRNNIGHADNLAMLNFERLCYDGEALTEKQGKYLIGLMKRHRDLVKGIIPGYDSYLSNPVFKHPFRVIDQTRKVWVETSENGAPSLIFKFPYSFLATFRDEISTSLFQDYDHDRKTNSISLYSVDLLKIIDFVERHGFEKDVNFINLTESFEIAIENQESIIAHSQVLDNQVEISNAPDSAQDFFSERKSGNIYKDLLLAKIMGYPYQLDKNPENFIEKLVSSKSTHFWIQDFSKIFELYKTVGGKFAIVLDRVEDIREWILDFAKIGEDLGVDREKIKVCFRYTDTENRTFNAWVKEQGLGGAVKQGDFFIFEHKVPKWLFQPENHPDFLISTHVNPPTNLNFKNLMMSHPCVFFLTDYKPTKFGEKNIVSL